MPRAAPRVSATRARAACSRILRRAGSREPRSAGSARSSSRRRASTAATMRSQRAPAKPKTSPVAISISSASDSRNIARARNSRVRTVACGTARQAAVSSTVISSTSRITNTVRNASGSLSILRSSSRRIWARIAADSRRFDRLLGLGAQRRLTAAAVLIIEQRDDAVALAAAQARQRLVDDDARQPGRQPGVAAELGQMPVRRDVGVLQRVLRIGVVLQDRPRDAEQRAVVAPHHRLEGRLVMVGNATNQLGVARRSQRLRTHRRPFQFAGEHGACRRCGDIRCRPRPRRSGSMPLAPGRRQVEAPTAA